MLKKILLYGHFDSNILRREPAAGTFFARCQSGNADKTATAQRKKLARRAGTNSIDHPVSQILRQTFSYSPPTPPFIIVL